MPTTLANQKDNIETGMANTKRNISETKLELEKEQLQLKNLRATHALAPPIKSIKPVNSSRRVILLLAILAGGFVALFAAFIQDFFIKSKN